MLKPGLGRTHRAYLWSYSSSEYDELPLVIYDFADSRSGLHAREFLGTWSGKLVCDDYSGYKALLERGVIEIGCMAHARTDEYMSPVIENGLPDGADYFVPTRAGDNGWVMSVRTTTNSSPPHRATVSDDRTQDCSRAAAIFRTSSPAL